MDGGAGAGPRVGRRPSGDVLMTKNTRGVMPPAMADYLVLRTVSSILARYARDPEWSVIETLSEGEAAEFNQQAFAGACRRLSREIEVRAENLYAAEEEYELLIRTRRERAN